MARKKAKRLTNEQINEVLKELGHTSRQPKRDHLWVMLSFRAGLRAQEISHLHVEDVTDAAGNLSDTLYVSGRGAKYGKERSVPITEDLKKALKDYIEEIGIKKGPMFYDQFARPMDTKTGANAAQQHLRRLYLNAGYQGCSSHSGRRTFITTLAQRANSVGASLRDVQRLAGHASLDSTEEYIDVMPNHKALVDLLTT